MSSSSAFIAYTFREGFKNIHRTQPLSWVKIPKLKKWCWGFFCFIFSSKFDFSPKNRVCYVAHQTLALRRVTKNDPKSPKNGICATKKTNFKCETKIPKALPRAISAKNYILFSASLCVQGKKWINFALSFHLPQNRFKKRI